MPLITEGRWAIKPPVPTQRKSSSAAQTSALLPVPLPVRRGEMAFRRPSDLVSNASVTAISQPKSGCTSTVLPAQSYRWFIRFVVAPTPKFGGIVTQKIEYVIWDITNCDTGEKETKPTGFFELIGVGAGGHESDIDEWGDNEWKCTKGEVKIVGLARFYENETGDNTLWEQTFSEDFAIDPGFKQNPNSPVDIGRKFFPRGSNSNTLRRTLTARWDCCDARQETKLTVE